MMPPASPSDGLPRRALRSAWRACRAAKDASASSMLEHLHHGAVWFTVKVAKLDHAKAVARAGAALLPPLSMQSARVVFDDLGTVGTCLSRSLTLASRLPNAEVAFGFDPARAPNFRPHAWVVVDGSALVAHDRCPTVLTTIRVGP